MSTIKVTNLQDTSGGNSSTSEEIFEGRAKAWINFNGSGTVAIRDDFNVSSITDTADGEYDVNLTNAMADTNYAILATTGIKTNRFRGVFERNDVTRTTTQFRITNAGQSASSSGLNSGETDSERISVAVFGD